MLESCDEPEQPTVLQIVDEEADIFETAIASVPASGLEDLLGNPGTVTVFAPTDDAFRDLPEGLLECLLLESNEGILTSVLELHILRTEVLSSDIITGVTFNGGELTFDNSNGPTVNGVSVSTTDLLASNGVVHLIDGGKAQKHAYPCI